MEKPIIPPNLAVKSMRDSGYKNTAYAIAELIDNSIQHGSTDVKLICLEKEKTLSMRTVSRIHKIAVLDNGYGMDKETLWMALQFGNGTNLSEEAQVSIGKFGMGLPSSSISQAIRLDVWTWQNSNKPLYSYLDVNEIINEQMKGVPEPVEKEIPKIWADITGGFSESGTLVIWSDLDRCLWKTGRTIIEHSEFIVGRMYRKFISDKKVKIQAISTKIENYKSPTIDKEIMANDPLYLTPNTSVSNALNELDLPDPMFGKYGGDDGYEKVYNVNFEGKKHKVVVRYSVATEETRKGKNAGGKKHGKHAGKNIGVSIVRAGRELDLDNSWTIGYDPRERWWGIEVDFPPSLDKVFGVTNNKQYAVNFRELGNLDIEQILKERDVSITEYKEELMQDNDLKALIIDIAKDIKSQLTTIRGTIKAQATKLEKSDERRHDLSQNEAEKHASEKTEDRKQEGYKGSSDEQETRTFEENYGDLLGELKEDDVPEPEILTETLLKSKIKYQFVEADIETPAFFSVRPVGGKIIIKLNVAHPAYSQFVEILSEDVTGKESYEDLCSRLITAKEGLKLLLMAWARYEDEQPTGDSKKKVKNTRMDWGRMASEFMEE